MSEKRFVPDRITYVRVHFALAAVAMGGAMAVLWVVGNPHVWTGAVAGLLGIGVRGWYLASEELAAVWELDTVGLAGPGGRQVPLHKIEIVRTLGGNVQIITSDGDKHLIKYQRDPAATAEAIKAARR